MKPPEPTPAVGPAFPPRPAHATPSARLLPPLIAEMPEPPASRFTDWLRRKIAAWRDRSAAPSIF